jgi:hypothetical protein
MEDNASKNDMIDENNIQIEEVKSHHLKKRNIMPLIKNTAKIFGLISCSSLLTVLTMPIWKNIILSDVKNISDLALAQNGLLKSNELQIKKIEDLAKKIETIDSLKNDFETVSQDLNNQILAIKNLITIQSNSHEIVQEQEKKTDHQDDACKKLTDLIVALEKGHGVKEIFHVFQNLKLSKDMKTILLPLCDVDFENLPNLDALQQEFETIKMKHGGSQDEKKENFKDKIVSNVKQNIKITVDGKNIHEDKHMMLDSVGEFLKQKKLSLVIEQVESLKDNAYLLQWLEKVKTRKIVDDVLVELKKYVGQIVE